MFTSLRSIRPPNYGHCGPIEFTMLVLRWHLSGVAAVSRQPKPNPLMLAVNISIGNIDPLSTQVSWPMLLSPVRTHSHQRSYPP